MKTIIQNGIISTASDTFKADIQMEDGVITCISERILPNEGDILIDASNQYVLPGGVDVHTHLAFAGTVDDFESGTKSAATGGITSIINYIEPNEEWSIIDNFYKWKERAKPSFIDYGFHPIINKYDDNVLEEITTLVEKEGISSIKLFMAYKDTLMIDDLEMYQLMKRSAELGVITNVHAENGDVIEQLINDALSNGNTSPINHAYTRPISLEAEATNRALKIAEIAKNSIYIVHVTCADALNEVSKAKQRGVNTYAETCPHYLVLDQSYLEKPNFEGAKYVCSPPLREKWNQEVLWKGIENGLISTIGSDHSSHPFEGGKTKGVNNFSNIPNGCPGIEDSYSLIYHFGVHEKRISLQKFVEITSSKPAKIFGMYPKKGTIMVGSDADIVIFDPHQSRVISEKEQYQSTDYNLYEGFEVKGKISCVFSRGELIVDQGSLKGKAGRGKYLYRKTSRKNLN